MGWWVSAKYSCGFPDPQVPPIIVVDRYLDHFTTIMDRLLQVLAKPVFRWRNSIQHHGWKTRILTIHIRWKLLWKTSGDSVCFRSAQLAELALWSDKLQSIKNRMWIIMNYSNSQRVGVILYLNWILRCGGAASPVWRGSSAYFGIKYRFWASYLIKLI